MVRRATEGTGEAAYQRLARRTEEAQSAMNDRLEAALDNIVSELGEIRSDVRRLDHGSDNLANRIADIERQVIDTRDEVQRRAVNPAPSQIASAKRAIKDTAKSPAGIVMAVCIFLTTITAAGGGIPKLIQGAERFWAFLAGREIPAIARPLVEPPAKVPEK